MIVITRDSTMENAKSLAELVDTKLARHYELDDSGKKKVKHLQNSCLVSNQALGPGRKSTLEDALRISHRGTHVKGHKILLCP